jgi:phospholipase C
MTTKRGAMAINQLGQIEHVVVVMLENRSFDNLLGWLYDPSNPVPFNQLPPPNFDGVYGKTLQNSSSKGPVPVGKGYQLTAPNPDPGEPYEDVYAQIFGQQTALPLNQVPPKPPTPPNMDGFVYDYTSHCQATDPKVIMNCFTPVSVPVLSSLAHYYGVCDHWFSSIPSQTLCNRSYVHAGTSSGYVDNEGGDGILFVNDTPTVFNLLSEAGREWKVYCAGWTVTSLVLLTQKRVWDFAVKPGYFLYLHDFILAAQKPSGLPSYSFIEPNYIDSLVWGPENDMHPESNPLQLYGPSNIEEGEKLLYKIYTAVRNSPDWNKTLLIVLFDEHGGCYDHVCPPAAISPDNVVIPQSKPGGSGFNFDRLGVRVPAIVVSPFTAAGTILNGAFDHTSVLSTVANCFDLPKGRLGIRQQRASDVGEALTLSNPRTDYPPIPQPASVTVSMEQRTEALGRALLQAKAKPVSELQRKILAGASQGLGLYDVQSDEIARVATSLEADALLMKLEAELVLRRRGSGLS